MKTRLMSLVLTAALLTATIFGTGVIPSAADGPSGDTYVYIPVKDLTNASRYSGSTIAENFLDTSIGGTDACGNKTLLLQNDGDAVEYDFDLDDGVSAAVLKVHAKHAVVSVKAAGGEWQTLTAKNGSPADRGVNLFDLTTADALASTDKQFTVRVSFGGQAVVLNGLVVQAEQPELTGSYMLEPLGESFLRELYDISAGATRYFADGTVPTVYLHPNEYVTFRFDYADNVTGLTYQYGIAGSTPLTGEVSTDGSAWTALPPDSGRIQDVVDLPEGNIFYLRFTARDGETFLKTLSLIPSYASIDAGRDLYLPLNSLASATRYGGDGIAENYNDAFDGGDANRVDNKTLLLQQPGDFVEYDLDLADDVDSALLKLYITSGLVEVKPEGGEFTALTAKNGSGFNRGVAIYALDETNALSGEGRRFTLRIRYDGATVVLNSLLLQTEENELSAAYELQPLGESYLRVLNDVSAGTTRYFADGNVPTVFLHNGEHVTFRFNYDDSAQGFTYTFSGLGAALTAEVSPDGSTWTALPGESGQLQDTAAPGEGNVFYLRFTANAGDAFLKTLQIIPQYAAVPVGSTWYSPVFDLSNTSAHGGNITENFLDSYSGGDDALVNNKTLLLGDAGAYVEYRFDPDDAITSAQLKLYIKDAVVSVKPEGGEYTVLTARNDQGGSFNRNVAIYDLNTDNALSRDDRRFTLRIESAAGSTVLQSMAIVAEEPELADAYTLDPLGESYLQNLYTISQGASRYFLDGTEPTVFLHTGESAVFHFNFTDEALGFQYAYTQAGAELKAEISADGAAWHPLPAGGRIEEAMELPRSRAFYIRFTAEIGDAFLKGLTITPVFRTVEEKNYVYLPVKDLSNADRFGGGSIVEGYTDAFTGGEDDKVDNKTLLLQSAGDYVEYDFDLPDTIDSALLKIYMKDGVVSVKPEGGEYTALKARNDQGGRFDRGVAIYDLTADNALTASSRKFTVRIACNGTDAVVVNGVLLDAQDAEIRSGRYTLDPLGESFLQGLWDLSQDTSRYFYNSSIPTVFIKNGGQVTFRLHFAPGGGGYTVSYQTQGAQATAEVSLNGKTWVPLKGERVDKAIDMSGTGTFFLRFSANDGETFLQTLTATREESEPPVQTNANPNVPKDADYVYFKPGTAAEEKYMFGLGVDYKGYFESTNDGMSIDGFEGGYNASLPNNVRLFHGKQVTYEFDLADGLQSARLKIYGLADMTFSVSTDEGETYDVLTTDYHPNGSGRGYYIFNLDETNALKNAQNKFRLQIKGAYGMLFELMIESGTPAIDRGVQFEAHGEDGMRYLEASSGLRTYFAYEAFPNYYLDGEGSLLFKLPFADGVDTARLYATYSGGVKIDISTRPDGGFENLLTSQLGSSGTPPTNVFDLSAYLRDSRTLYVRVTGTAEGGFVDSLGVAVTSKDVAEGGFTAFSGAEADYLYSILNNDRGIGSSMRQTASLSKVRGVDVGGEIVYKFDLPNDVNGVDVVIDAQGKYDLTASTDGENFSTVTNVGKATDAIRIQDVLTNSTDKVLYLKIRNTSASDILLLYSLKFSTKGVPEPYARPQTPDFDYGKTLPDSFPTVEKLQKPQEPEATRSTVTTGGFPWLWVGIGGGVVILAAGGLTVLLLVRRSKRKGKTEGKA